MQGFCASLDRSRGPPCPPQPAEAAHVLAIEDQALVDRAFGGDAGPDAAEAQSNTYAAPPVEATWEDKQQQQAKSRKVCLQHLSLAGDGPLARVVVLGLVLEPQRKAMQAMLLLSGEGWELSQQSLQARALMRGQLGSERDLRGLVAATCKIEGEIIWQAWQLMSQSSSWEAVPPHSRTATLRNLAFKSLAMTIALINELMDYHQGYPFKLFKLLLVPPEERDDFVAEVLSDDHLWCDWSRGFIAHWLGPGIGCEAALVDLRTTLALASFDTARLETKHAAVRRLVKVLSTQTSAESVSLASALEILRRYRAHAKALRPLLEGLLPSAACSPQSSAQADRHEGGGCNHDAQEPLAKQRKRGGGGPWRAFIALNAGSGSPDLGYLATLYRNLDEGEKEELHRLGAQGTRRHREGDGRSFGPTGKDRQRARAATEFQNSVQQAQSATQASSGLRSILDDKAAGDPDMAVAVAASDGPNAWSRVLAVKALCKAQARLELESRNAGSAAIDEFQASPALGKSIIQACTSTVPALAGSDGVLQAVPTGPIAGAAVHHLHWRPVDALKDAGSLMALARGAKVMKAANAMLECFWGKLHEQISSDPLPTNLPKPPKRACFNAGLCVCGANSYVATIAARAVKGMKAAACNKLGRKMLQQGDFVLALVGRSREQVEAAPGDAEALVPSECLWRHVAFASLSPDRPSWHHLHGDAKSMQGICEGPHRLRSTGKFSTCWKGLAKLSKELRWDMAVFLITDSSRMLGSFQPDCIDVAPAWAAVASLRVLWDPWARRGRGKWGFDFDEIVDNISEDSAGDGDDNSQPKDSENEDENEHFEEEDEAWVGDKSTGGARWKSLLIRLGPVLDSRTDMFICMLLGAPAMLTATGRKCLQINVGTRLPRSETACASPCCATHSSHMQLHGLSQRSF